MYNERNSLISRHEITQDVLFYVVHINQLKELVHMKITYNSP